MVVGPAKEPLWVAASHYWLLRGVDFPHVYPRQIHARPFSQVHVGESHDSTFFDGCDPWRLAEPRKQDFFSVECSLQGAELLVQILRNESLLLRICLQDGWMLLVADSLLFPCIYISDAIGRGVMTRHLLPQGSGVFLVS